MPLYRTLGEIRADIQAMTGFGATGASAGVNLRVIDGFIRTAQSQLYWAGAHRVLQTYVDTTIGASQTLVDYPEELHPERITKISIKFSGVWSPALMRGIAPEHYTHQDNPGPPSRYEFYDQIEFWPESDAVYEVRIWGLKPLQRLTQDGDRTTIDSDLVQSVALGMAKAHYRQPDAQFYVDQASNILGSLKSSQWTGRVFNPRQAATQTMPKPQVLDRDT